MSLGDPWQDFPRRGEKKTKELLKPGFLLRAYVPDFERPKVKMQIVVGVTGDGESIATVYVNSKVNPKYRKSEKFQIKLEARGRKYLEHDSYVDCEVPIERETNKLIDYLNNSNKKSYCKIAPNDLEKVKAALCDSLAVSHERKEKYGLTE